MGAGEPQSPLSYRKIYIVNVCGYVWYPTNITLYMLPCKLSLTPLFFSHLMWCVLNWRGTNNSVSGVGGNVRNACFYLNWLLYGWLYERVIMSHVWQITIVLKGYMWFWLWGIYFYRTHNKMLTEFDLMISFINTKNHGIKRLNSPLFNHLIMFKYLAGEGLTGKEIITSLWQYP